MISTKELLIRNYLNDSFNKLGYFKDEQLTTCYKHENDFGFNRICYDVKKVDSNFELTYIIQKRINVVEELWDKYKVFVGLGNQPPSITIGAPSEILNEYELTQKEKIESEIKFGTKKNEILDGVDDFIGQLRNTVFPVFQIFEEYGFLNSVCNSSIDNIDDINNLFNAQGLVFRKMIIASIAEDSRYEEICDYAKGRINKAWGKDEDKLGKWLEVFNYISKNLDTKGLGKFYG